MMHEPVNSNSYITDPRVDQGNPNFFKVPWKNGDYPNTSNSCANNACSMVEGQCICSISTNESVVFSSLPTLDEIQAKLFIGSVDPRRLEGYSLTSNTDAVEVWQKDSNGYSASSIFGVNYRGKKIFLKNILSTVSLIGSELSFRNPPHHMNIAVREPRDAIYETEAVLHTYFYHDNLPPFLAYRLIQRFGTSNPSPRYVEAVANAFKTGTFNFTGKIFGDGKYGNLSSTIAAIILDREATTVVLDADPFSGALFEPLMKVIGFMRAMEFESRAEAGKEIRFDGLQSKIGQESHSSPGVFSFFLPEYQAPGKIKASTLVSPEAQVLSGPKIINLMNGLISLVDLGFNECYGGFAQPIYGRCASVGPNFNGYNMGRLTFLPSNPNDASQVVDELSLLLTGGRLSQDSRSIIANAYSSLNHIDGLRLAQKLILTTPEFHSNNVVDTKADVRPDAQFPQPSSDRYKAVIFLKIDGGMDSWVSL